MAHWNYRVIHYDKPKAMEEPLYGLYEVYYRADDSIYGWTEEPVRFWGESPTELRETLERALRACAKPVLRLSELEAALTETAAESPPEAPPDAD